MSFSKFDIPIPVLRLIETLHAQSMEGWLVGGAVRTLLLGQKPADWDVTTNATPAQIQKIFPHTIETGVAYGTVTVVIDSMQIQVTTFRKEGEYENHRKPSEVFYCQNLEEDLSRRDFTINAMAYNPVTDEIRDPFDGQLDLERQWIKAVGDPRLRFQEDALRILRAIRFQSQLGFLIEEETLQAMSQASKLLTTLSKERIQQEIGKWLLGDYFSITKPTAQQINLFQIFEIPPAHGFFEKWDLIPTIEPTLLFRLCAFFDVYTGQTAPQNKTGNSLKSLKSLKCSQQLTSKVVQFIDFLSIPLNVDLREERLVFVKKALEIGFSDSILLLDWKLQQSDGKSLYLKAKNLIIELRQKGYEKQVYPLAIDGNRIMKILNLEPGPQVKKVLNDLENWVLENPDRNSVDQLESQLRKK